MHFFLISFRKEYTKTCLRSCRCYEGGNESDLKFYYCQTYEELLEKLKVRIVEDKEADYVNLVVTRWEDLKELSEYSYHPSDFYYVNVVCNYTDFDAEGWEEENQYYEETQALEDKLRKDINNYFKQT